MEEEDILTIQSMLFGVEDHNMEVDQPEAKKLKEWLSIDLQGMSQISLDDNSSNVANHASYQVR